jgi:hypothetical protein
MLILALLAALPWLNPLAIITDGTNGHTGHFDPYNPPR